LQDPHYAVIFITAFWIGLVYIVSYISGWRDLAEKYPYRGEVLTEKRHFLSLSMRFASNYNGCVTIGGNPQGLYLSVLFIFRPGHPPLFIPWHEIEAEHKKVFNMRTLILRTMQCPNNVITVRGNSEEFLENIKGSPLIGNK
jgi:hypothetical protein